MAPLRVSVPDESLVDAVSDLPGVAVLVWGLDAPAPVDSIDLVVVPYLSGLAPLARLTGVATRLVQSQSIGYDGVADALGPGVTFANAASVHEASTAELAVALILASLRGIPEFVRAQDVGRWAHERRRSLADSAVLLVGYGGVNRAIEARLAGFEVVVARVARTARDTPTGFVHAMADLPHLLASADVVVIGVPLTDDTRGLVDEGFLGAMRDGAVFVNVSRGAVADTGALVAHAGRLSLALDVVDPEPLPSGHPLWRAPRTLISPHVGGATSAMTPRVRALIRAQAERMLAGEPPINVVIRT
ncbi:MAG TPA: 2-hydroxyacid dehydrogenase [Acidimicrobiales bacterium]|nr:2-hydroxyacid dehydrogenase [Acidimicrobiales bacterium]